MRKWKSLSKTLYKGMGKKTKKKRNKPCKVIEIDKFWNAGQRLAWPVKYPAAWYIFSQLNIHLKITNRFKELFGTLTLFYTIGDPTFKIHINWKWGGKSSFKTTGTWNFWISKLRSGKKVGKKGGIFIVKRGEMIQSLYRIFKSRTCDSSTAISPASVNLYHFK